MATNNNSGDGSKVDSKKVKKASDRATKRLTAGAQRDIELMRNAVRQLETRIVKLTNDLRTSDLGLLMGPRVNLKQAQELHKNLTQILKETYGASARRAVNGYKDAAQWVLDNFNEIDIAAKFTRVDLTMLTQLRRQKLLGFLRLGEQASRRVTEALYNSIAAQTPFENLVDEISAALTGRVSKRGVPLTVYAEQYANDSIMDFYNTVQIEKSRGLGLRYMLYVGNVMDTTRPFCRKRVGKAYTIAQINSWTHRWEGKSGPALTNRGGYNCRHHWQPVKKEWLKKFQGR